MVRALFCFFLAALLRAATAQRRIYPKIENSYMEVYESGINHPFLPDSMSLQDVVEPALVGDVCLEYYTEEKALRRPCFTEAKLEKALEMDVPKVLYYIHHYEFLWWIGEDMSGAYCGQDRKCHERKGKGEACEMNRDGIAECAPGLLCAGQTGKSKCVKALSAGDICDANSLNWLAGLDVCSFGSFCRMDAPNVHRCFADSPGTACSNSDGCKIHGKEHECVGGVCAPKGEPVINPMLMEDGDECTSNSKCKSGLCRWTEDVRLCTDSMHPPHVAVTSFGSGGSPGEGQESSLWGKNGPSDGKCQPKARCVKAFSLDEGAYTSGPNGESDARMCKAMRLRQKDKHLKFDSEKRCDTTNKTMYEAAVRHAPNDCGRPEKPSGYSLPMVGGEFMVVKGAMNEACAPNPLWDKGMKEAYECLKGVKPNVAGGLSNCKPLLKAVWENWPESTAVDNPDNVAGNVAAIAITVVIWIVVMPLFALCFTCCWTGCKPTPCKLSGKCTAACSLPVPRRLAWPKRAAAPAAPAASLT